MSLVTVICSYTSLLSTASFAFHNHPFGKSPVLTFIRRQTFFGTHSFTDFLNFFPYPVTGTLPVVSIDLLLFSFFRIGHDLSCDLKSRQIAHRDLVRHLLSSSFTFTDLFAMAIFIDRHYFI